MLPSRDSTPCLKTRCSFFLISLRASHSILRHLKTRIMSDTVKTIIQVNTVTNRHRIICPHPSTSPHPNTCHSLQPAQSKASSSSTINRTETKSTVMEHFHRSNNSSYWTIRTITTCSSRILMLGMLLVHRNLNICYHLSCLHHQTCTKPPSNPPVKPPC